MEYKYKQEEEGNGEYIAFESSLKEYSYSYKAG